MKKRGILGIIKDNALSMSIALVSIISLVIIVIVIVINSDTDENIAILEAGNKNIPIIKAEDLDYLGRVYTTLNEQFEREIDELTLGNTNRHNLTDNRINALTHYGVYGQDNPNPFKNDEYTNGIRITYEKDNSNIPNGASNFNDIVAVMAMMYDQQMDTIPIEKLEETFTKLFWMSHTYTYDSDELYPCRYGCSSVNRYKCTDVYKDYQGSNLKYHPFTVPPHDLYTEAGFEDEEDFIIQVPERMCDVHGKSGAGCEWEPTKICYHGSGKVPFKDYNDKKYQIIKKVGSGENEEKRVFEGPIYVKLGSIVVPEYEEEKYLGPEPVIESGTEAEESEGGSESSSANAATSGGKIDKDDMSCTYYMNVQYCSEREKISKDLAEVLKEIDDISDNISKEQEKETPSESTLDRLEEQKNTKEEEKRELEEKLNEHISTICESNEEKAKYWCDGFKLCLGHRTHYKCKGHKVIVCYGHTNINITVKILYRDKMLEKLYETMR